MSLHPTSPTTTTTSATQSPHHFFTGVLVLFAAQLISACMGIFVESTYATYGRHWRETLFYSHFLGCFFSLAFLPALSSQLTRLSSGPVTTIGVPTLLSNILPMRLFPTFFGADASASTSTSGGAASLHVPTSLLLLLLNALTQVVCISGVNQLSAHTTAVTVTVVLNIRKLVSFLLSCIIFGNPVDGLMGVGAVIVFASGALYGWDSGRRKGVEGGVAKELVNTPSREKGIKRVDEGGDERVGNGKVG